MTIMDIIAVSVAYGAGTIAVIASLWEARRNAKRRKEGSARDDEA